jgi:hypothetical protein
LCPCDDCDTDTFMRILHKGYQICLLPQLTAYHTSASCYINGKTMKKLRWASFTVNSKTTRINTYERHYCGKKVIGPHFTVPRLLLL